MTDRRGFLGASAALLLAGCAGEPAELPPGRLVTTRHRLGHRLRDGTAPAARERRNARIVIVGAGIGGLSAAWRLRRAGCSDFVMLELEDHAGGNARWDRNEVSAYPWGAHYVPLPTPESRATRLLLAELGVLLGDPDAAVPRYEERALVHAPQERLYRNGSWSERLVPLEGRGAAEVAEWRRFQARIDELKGRRGRDGRRAFAIPVDLSSRDPALLALDRQTFASWLRAEGFVSEAVHWVANYACRDDYGCDYRQVSAWAGLHYFAARVGAGRDADHDAVLTWPEGNGFVVRELLARYRPEIVTGALVHRVEEARDGVVLTVLLGEEGRAMEIRAEQVIWAAPFAFGARAFADRDLARAMAAYEHGAWVTANLTLDEPPFVDHGAPLSWDNVLYDSPSLGYIVATHQSLASRPGATVLTWYLPLAAEAPAAARKRLLGTPREHWVEMALQDLSVPHPEVRELVARADVFANGHAMVLPRPGLIWGGERARILAHRGRVHFAHGDASGISIFEEANDRGVAAAEAVLAALGEKVETFRA